MIVIVGDEGGISEGLLRVVSDNVIKGICNFEGLVEFCFAGSTIVDGDRDFDLSRGFFAFNDAVKTDRLVRGDLIFQTIIEIADSVLERGFDEVVANFHVCCGRLDFFL